MELRTVAILSPGDMGHAVGRALAEHGLEVVTCLEGRSARTRGLAAEGGIRDLATLEGMASEADLVLSILVPSDAIAVATEVAAAMRSAGSTPPFADCNAVSPQSAAVMDDIVSTAGGLFIDGSIIGGPPPGGGASPRFYVSGAGSKVMEALDGKGIVVRSMGDEIGRASAIKMCYAAGTKGTAALHAALLTAAEALGISDELEAELRSSQPDVYGHMEGQVPRLPIKAGRWIGEMEEIAATFDHVGITPRFHQGAADMFRLLDQTPFAQETPETMERGRTIADTISVVAGLLPPNTEGG